MAFDSASSSQTARLRNYIVNDTPSIGLSFTKTNGVNRRLMESASTESAATLAVSAIDLQGAVDGPELIALSAPRRSSWQTLLIATGTDGVDLNSTGIDSQIEEVWSTSAATFGALGSLKTRAAVSYSEDLFGVGTILSKQDIAAARPSAST